MAHSYRRLLSYYIKLEYAKITNLSKHQHRKSENFLPLKTVYLGPKVAAAVYTNIFSDAHLHNFRINCLNFYIETAHQNFENVPFNAREVEIFNMLSFFNPANRIMESLGLLSSNSPHSFQKFQQFRSGIQTVEITRLQF